MSSSPSVARGLITIGWLALCMANPAGAAPPEVVRLGKGSYFHGLPADAQGPPSTIYRTENLRGPTPTGDWCSSVLWLPFSENQFPHPLAVRAEKTGLRISYPGVRQATGERAVVAPMPGGGEDLTIGLEGEGDFRDARLHKFSDWFVTVRFQGDSRALSTTYGHGSPFVYVLADGADVALRLPRAAEIWSGDAESSAIGLTIGRAHYGLFGPAGCKWAGLEGKSLRCRMGDKNYLTVALLPDRSQPTLERFARYAHVHVRSTSVEWKYDEAASEVETTFRFDLQAMEGEARTTLFALYPHQARYSQAPRAGGAYDSIRGKMPLAEGAGFVTRTPFPGLLPVLPVGPKCDAARLKELVRRAVEESIRPRPPKDTYWEGKDLGKLAVLAGWAESAGDRQSEQLAVAALRQRLAVWLNAAAKKNTQSKRVGFCYEPTWGTLIGVPPSYGSARELNDHHFHYGYFLQAAAAVARRDPEWASQENYGGMLRLLIDDIACPRRDDEKFPFLRQFDPYAGHSWASGHARFADGNNQESSSEAMNAWRALVLLGEATGDRQLRDLGVYLYATELAAIEEYWFDVHQSSFPVEFKPEAAALVWGGKAAHETWFSANPEAVFGINWLPVTAGSLYLGRHPGYVRRAYEDLIERNGGETFDAWADLMWMYRALHDADAALAQYRAAPDAPREEGNSAANTYGWITLLQSYGQVDRTVTARTPLYAVLRKGNERTYIAHNMGKAALRVRFSDGFELICQPRATNTARRKVAGP